MRKITFKQFNDYLESPLQEEEQLDEIFGMFQSKEKRAAAEQKKLELLAKRGDEVAKMKLRTLKLNSEKMSAAEKLKKDRDNKLLKQAQAETEAAERGSSRAYDKEAGSAGKKIEPKWNAARGEWEKYDSIRKQWVGTGNSDKYSKVAVKRGS